MSAGRLLWMGLRLMAAGIAYLVCFVTAYGLVVRGTPPSPGVEPISPGLALLLVSALSTVVMGWLILRSRLTGWSLAAAMVLLFYGVQTFMPQVESLIFQASPGFASHLPAAVVPRLLLAGLLHACLWIPLAGVLYWGWDTFQLLMLYWTETVIVAFWTLMRIATLPARQLGTLTVNGVVRTATNLMMVGFFCLHAGMFIFVHLVFLLVLFSGDWFKKAHGVGGFFSELYLI